MTRGPGKIKVVVTGAHLGRVIVGTQTINGKRHRGTAPQAVLRSVHDEQAVKNWSAEN
jgi:hypothetical protein